MKFAIWCAALAVLITASCATSAPLTISGTMPAYDNAGSCTSPTLISYVGTDSQRRIVFTWSGPSSGVDSIYVQPGAAFVFNRILPTGSYLIHIHAANAAGAGCDTVLSKNIFNLPVTPVVQ